MSTLALLYAVVDAYRLQSSLIRLSARAERVSPSVDDSGEIERMHNAVEDLYILYIEETLSTSAVYTILSSRPQSFLASFSALCTIHRSTVLYTPSILIHCFCISPFSPGQGWATEAKVGVGEAGGEAPALHASCQQGISFAESLPPRAMDASREAPSPVARSILPHPGDGGTPVPPEGLPPVRRWDGAPGPGGTVGAGRRGGGLAEVGTAGAG